MGSMPCKIFDVSGFVSNVYPNKVLMRISWQTSAQGWRKVLKLEVHDSIKYKWREHLR